MARLAPVVSSTTYSGIQGDRRVKHVKLAVDGAYTAAAASDGGVLLTPALVGMTSITSVSIEPTFTADTVEEYVTSVGPSTSTTAGWVLALSDKADNLQSANGTVADVVAYATVVGF